MKKLLFTLAALLPVFAGCRQNTAATTEKEFTFTGDEVRVLASSPIAGKLVVEPVSAGAYDACTIFGALHQESPEDIVAILGRAFRALKPGGALFVLDMMTDATRASPPFSALFGLNMALTTKNGWVFSDDELKGWMREAGFEPGETRPAPPPMPHWLVAAVRP